MKAQQSLKVSLHGMNSRMQAMMASYLELNCNRIANVVDDAEAEAEIVDVDLSGSTNILEERLAQQPSKPIIVLSLYDDSSNLRGVVYVKKPVKVDELIKAINKVKNGNALEVVAKNSDDSMPELAELLKKNRQEKLKQIEKNKDKPSVNNVVETEKKRIDSNNNLGKTKNKNQPLTEKDAEVLRETKDIVSINSTRPRPEIDKFLREFNYSIQKKDPNKKRDKKINLHPSINNRRNTVRYVFQAITGCLKKNSLLGGLSSSLPVIVEAISSKGALIKVEKTLKLSRKVILEIELDSKYVFTIPAKVIRQNSHTTYGLAFLDYQHKLTEYLIGSGRSFNIK